MFCSIQSKLCYDLDQSKYQSTVLPPCCEHSLGSLSINWGSWAGSGTQSCQDFVFGCSPYLVFFPNSPASGWCEGVTPQFPQSFYPWVPREKSCAPGVPCSSRSLWLDTFLPSLNSDPVFPESAPLLPWLAVWLLSIQLWSHQVIPPLHISGRPGLWLFFFPDALFCSDTE